MRIKRFLGVAILAALPVVLITCGDNDEITPRPYPSVKTKEVSRITSEGATFEGELVSLSDGVIDHGFLVSNSSTFSVGDIEKISLGPTSQKGTFQGVLEQSMEEKADYYVRAYAKSKSHEVQGNIVKFVSLGSKGPELLSISPTTASWGDKVILKGNRFTTLENKVVVMFGDAKANIWKATTDSIVCTVPADLRDAPSTVSVSVFGNISELEDAFQLKKPIITSISPSRAHVRHKVTIKGDFFSSTPKTDVFFGAVKAEVTKNTRTEIEFIVPSINVPNPVKLTIRSGTGNLFAETEFEIIRPTVSSFTPKTGTFRSTVVFTGQSIDPTNTNTRVTFDDVEAQIISMTETEITVTVPDNLTKAVNQVGLFLEPWNGAGYGPFTLLPPEITSIEPAGRLLNGIFNVEISGNNFSFINNEVKLGSLSLQPSSQSESFISVPAYNWYNEHELDLTVTVAGQSVVVENRFYSEWLRLLPTNQFVNTSHKPMFIGDDFYLMVGILGDDPKLYLFDETEKEWRYKGVTPTPVYFEQFTFSLNGKGYVGGGSENAMEYDDDLFEYNPATNQWTKKNDLPFTNKATVFVVNNTVYAATNDYMTPGNLWEYNPVTDSWIQKNDIAQKSDSVCWLRA